MRIPPKGFELAENISEHLFSMLYKNLVPIRDISSRITNFKFLNCITKFCGAFPSKVVNVWWFIGIFCFALNATSCEHLIICYFAIDSIDLLLKNFEYQILILWKSYVQSRSIILRSILVLIIFEKLLYIL